MIIFLVLLVLSLFSTTDYSFKPFPIYRHLPSRVSVMELKIFTWFNLIILLWFLKIWLELLCQFQIINNAFEYKQQDVDLHRRKIFLLLRILLNYKYFKPSWYIVKLRLQNDEFHPRVQLSWKSTFWLLSKHNKIFWIQILDLSCLPNLFCKWFIG